MECKNKKGWKLGRQGTTVGVPSTATLLGTKQEISGQARMAVAKEKPSAGLGRGQFTFFFPIENSLFSLLS